MDVILGNLEKIPPQTHGETVVHVYWLFFSDFYPWVSALEQFLSQEELARGRRFKSPVLQQNFIINKAVLRSLLGMNLAIPPQGLQFAKGPQGKPRLAAQNHIFDLHFNLSHSADLLLCGICVGEALGVDVEYLPHLRRCDALARRFFCATEAQTIQRLPSPQKERAFMRAWTAKEAYWKAIGTGLAGGLNRVEINLDLHRPPRIVAQPTPMGPPWQLFPIPLPDPYMATGAIAHNHPTIHIAQLQPRDFFP